MTAVGGAIGLAGLNRLGGSHALAADPANAAPPRNAQIRLAGTDGWISLPPDTVAPSQFYPDVLAASPFTTYAVGFRDVTGMGEQQVLAQRGKAQACGPLIVVDEGGRVDVTLTNLGMSVRPDLVDSHTLHWHGFRNAIPRFDGVPETSISAPIGRDLPYVYFPRDAGTYMYHCHFEDVEHIQMGMTGILVVRPTQNRLLAGEPLAGGRYAYNDGDGTTRYDREFALLLTEMWLASHWRLAHVQESNWTQYQPSAWLINGRSYPDTLLPNGDPMRPAADPRMQYQPVSSLVTANAGDEVLLRFANLGYQERTLSAPGLKLRVVGRDATLLRGRDGTNLSFRTSTVTLGPGESTDVIFTAPAVSGVTKYMLCARDFGARSTVAGGYGGQTTEIHVHPSETLPAQVNPNE
jgi:FtsP/CotA-like multicopper oxidase with cupredoxin domain